MISGMSRRLPYPIDVTCNHGRLNDFIPSFNFIVILNNFTFGFSEVSGLDKDMSAEEIREGGNVYPVFTRKYEYNFEQITLSKGLLIREADYASDSIRTALSQAALLNNSLARKAAIIAAASSDPIATLEQGPAYGFLQVFDRKYKTALTSFSFFSYGASRWDITNLNASSNDFLYENITLVCSDLKRLSNSALPSRIWNEKISEDQRSHNYYELTKEQKKQHKKTYTRDDEQQSAEEHKTNALINAAKQNDENIKEDKKNRIEAFQKWQESIKFKREKEEELAKKKAEDDNKLMIDKMVEEIQKLDETFTADGKTKQEILNEWQKLTQGKRKEEKEILEQKLKDNEKLIIDKIVKEIQKIDETFTPDGKTRQQILDKWQEVTKSKREENAQKLNEEQNEKSSENDINKK